MSYEAAIGKIDQILQWQQQILDPASAASSLPTGPAGSAGTAATGNPSAFAAALEQAQASTTGPAISPQSATASTDPLAAGSAQFGMGGSQFSSLVTMLTGSQAASTAPSYAATAVSGAGDRRVQAMVQEANSLVGKPYVWGGGHSGWGPQAGYDCSGFVSAVLHAGGYLTSPQDTTTLPSAPGIEPGPGQHVTIYDRSQPGENGHVIIEIDGQFYESGGAQGTWGGGGGVERIGTPSATYLSTFDTILHPAGL